MKEDGGCTGKTGQDRIASGRGRTEQDAEEGEEEPDAMLSCGAQQAVANDPPKGHVSPDARSIVSSKLKAVTPHVVVHQAIAASPMRRLGKNWPIGPDPYGGGRDVSRLREGDRNVMW